MPIPALFMQNARFMARVRSTFQRGALDTRAIARRRALLPRFGAPIFQPVGQIQNAPHSRRLLERFQIKGPAAITTLAPELQPVVIMEDMTIDAKANEETPCGDGIPITPGAGNICNFGIVNFGTSTVLVRPQRITFTTTEATTPNIIKGSFVDSLGLPASFTSEILTKFVAGFPQATFLAHADLPGVVVAGLAVGSWALQPFTNLTIDLREWTIPPGKALLFNSSAAAIQLTASAVWLEKPAGR